MVARNISAFAACLLPLACVATAWAASPATISAPVDEQQTISLPGNTRPEAKLTNDRGRLADNFGLDHMQLLLKRSPQTEAALDTFIDSLHDRTSPNFHQWLTAPEFAARFGPAPADIAAVADWLTAHGFVVNGVAAGGMTLDFSGTAGQVRAAFHTEMHQLNVAGVSHIANMSDPQIPAALSGVVAGVVSLNDFRPHPNFKPRPAYTVKSGARPTSSWSPPTSPPSITSIRCLPPAFPARGRPWW